jgi:hypothetical protein
MTDEQNPPRSILEREAWLKAGADLATLYSFVAALAVGAVVALVAAIFRLTAQDALFVLSGAFLLCLVGSAGYVHFAARRIVLRGGVQVDRF